MVSLMLASYRDLERRGQDQGEALVMAAPIGHVGREALSKVNVGAKFRQPDLECRDRDTSRANAAYAGAGLRALPIQRKFEWQIE